MINEENLQNQVQREGKVYSLIQQDLHFLLGVRIYSRMIDKTSSSCRVTIIVCICSIL